MKISTKSFFRAGALVLCIVAGAALATTLPGSNVPLEPDLLHLFPAQTSGILFIDVAGLRSVPLAADLIREHAGVTPPDGLEDFIAATGFDPQSDLDVLALGSSDGGEVLVAARARYDADRIALYFQEKEVAAEPYGGAALYQPDPAEEWKVSFVDEWILAGQDALLRGALDRRAEPVGTAMDNVSLVSGIESIEVGSQVWAAGAFADNILPDGVAPPMATDLIASLERGTYQMRFGEIVTGRAVGEFATAEAAGRTSNLLVGLLTLGRIQASEYPPLLQLLDSFQIEALDSSVHLSFAIDPALLQEINESDLRIR